MERIVLDKNLEGKILAVLQINWADEIDVTYFQLFDSVEDVLKHKKHYELCVKEYDESISISIGSNQWIDFESVEELYDYPDYYLLDESEEDIVKQIVDLSDKKYPLSH